MSKKSKKNKKSTVAWVCGILAVIGVAGAFAPDDSTAGQTDASFSGDRGSAIVQSAAPSVEPEPSELLPPVESEPLSTAEPTPEPTPSPTPEPTPAPSYKLVASRESDKYHRPNCRWVENISQKNIIYFDSIEQAKAAGYKACGTCKPG